MLESLRYMARTRWPRNQYRSVCRELAPNSMRYRQYVGTSTLEPGCLPTSLQDAHFVHEPAGSTSDTAPDHWQIDRTRIVGNRYEAQMRYIPATDVPRAAYL